MHWLEEGKKKWEIKYSKPRNYSVSGDYKSNDSHTTQLKKTFLINILRAIILNITCCLGTKFNLLIKVYLIETICDISHKKIDTM